ncbi:MAG: HAD family hydrolase [Rudaea sp.]
MMRPGGVVVLLDVDNTLLDNDRIETDIDNRLEREFGAVGRQRYWKIFEVLREELGYADYLGALQRFRLSDMNEPRLPLMAAFLLDYPFAERLYPAALDVVRHLGALGRTVILSDGDAVFQPRKVQRSGLWDAVDGRVLIYIHKEQMLEAIVRRYPAAHYVMVDDKLRVLQAMKIALENLLTTVFVRQGHYALDPKHVGNYRKADMTVENIGALLDWDFSTMPGISEPAPLARRA